MNSTEVYNRFISESAAGGDTADALWSSAMDLQIKLAAGGYAMAYKSRRSEKIPGWAIWKDMAYGTTFEPAAFVYNKRLVTGAEIPQTHADFARIISQADKFQGKVTTYDIEKSGVGFMFMTQDEHDFRSSGSSNKAFGAARVRVQSSTGTMLERISSGENLIGYNVLGSYALVRAKTDPSLGVVLPEGLHAGDFARPVHQQIGQAPERRQAVARLPAVAARPDRDRQRSPSCSRSAPT